MHDLSLVWLWWYVFWTRSLHQDFHNQKDVRWETGLHNLLHGTNYQDLCIMDCTVACNEKYGLWDDIMFDKSDTSYIPTDRSQSWTFKSAFCEFHITLNCVWNLFWKRWIGKNRTFHVHLSILITNSSFDMLGKLLYNRRSAKCGLQKYNL